VSRAKRVPRAREAEAVQIGPEAINKVMSGSAHLKKVNFLSLTFTKDHFFLCQL
jgi:hypothetical protein